MSDLDHIRAEGVPVELRPGLTVRLKYNMLSAAALEKRYETDNPLVAYLVGDGVSGPLCYSLAAGLLHDGAIPPQSDTDQIAGMARGDVLATLTYDLEGLIKRQVTPEAEADRISAMVMVLLEDTDVRKYMNAIAKAQDLARALAVCVEKGCGHRYSEHDYAGPCQQPDCDCEGYQGPKPPVGKADAPEASTGAGSGISPQAEMAAPTPSSGS